MAALTTATANRYLNWLKGTTYTAAPTTLYVALFTTAPGPNAEGTEVSTSGTAYIRRSITSASGWSAISGTLPGTPRQISNAGDLIWPTATADWGLIVGWALYDASTAGNRLLYEAWGTSKQQTIVNGNVFKVLTGNLVITNG